MAKDDFCHLPFELVLKISEYLSFSDVWYLGTCSRQSRILSYQILKQQYDIDLIQPRVINPFGHLIHAAVAYIGRYGVNNDGSIEASVLQSVANHMAIAIYDRIPSKTDCKEQVDYDESLNQIMSTIDKSSPTETVSEQVDIYAIESTGVLMVDFLSTLYQTISALFDTEFANDIHHRLLLSHLYRMLDGIKHKYHIYHANLSSFSESASTVTANNNYTKSFRIYIKFLCVLIQTELVTAKDIEEFTCQYINKFFMTQPSDVSFSTQGGFKIVMRNTNQNLAIVNTVSKNKRPAFYYQWKLWLQETQFRLSVLLDLMRALVHKNATSSPPIEFKQFSILLKDAVSALTLSQSMNQSNEQHGQIISI
ncbi:unnamed protein product [Mucor hiemalis]